MDRPGEKLRRTRERLKLTYRDVEEASLEIAGRRGKSDFAISLSRLADIENGGRVPTIFRLYTLCAIYRLDLHEVMRWYGVPVEMLGTEALQVGLEETHLIEITPNGATAASLPAGAFNPAKTTFLSPLIREWGRARLTALPGFSPRTFRYGLLGEDDWSMFPLLRPGALLLIDQSRRRPARGGWRSETDRPVYFLEHREGFLCGWCGLENGRLIVQFHPGSERCPRIFDYPSEVEVIGQVVGAAMGLERESARAIPAQPAKAPVKSPDRPEKAAVPPRELTPE